MKILLLKVNTLKKHDRDAFFPALLYPLLSIASYANSPDRLRIAVFPDDMNYINESLRWCDAVGFSAHTFEYETVRSVAGRIRKRFPDKVFFIGGTHPSMTGSCDYELFDCMVAGEGERVVRSLIADSIRIYRLDGPKSVRCDRSLTPEELPIIKNSYYPFWKRHLKTNNRKLGIFSARGCPFRNCRFCTSLSFEPRLRRMPPDRFVMQIAEYISETGINEFNIWDDAFANNISYIEEVIDGLAAKNIAMKNTSCFIRFSDRILVEKEFLLLKRAGIEVLLPGLETGSERLMRYLKGNNARLDNIKANLLLAKKLGFVILGSVMLGNPTETPEDMYDTLAFMDWFYKNGVNGVVWPYVATPWPGTEYWDIALKNGKVSPDMDFDELRYDNFRRPLLLESGIPPPLFRKIFAKAKAASKKMTARAVARGIC